jgi:hypothetical protein
MKVFTHSIALILILGYTSLFSQVNKSYDGPKPEVEKGAKSFIFQYTPFQSNLEPVYVGTVSYPDEYVESKDLFGAGFQYYITDQIALALGLSFGSSSSTLDSENSKTETSNTEFGVGIDANYHLASLYGVSPYIGVNVNFSSLSGTNEYTPTGQELQKTEISGSGFGAAAQFGFDWYFTEGLSLGGKYSLGFRSLGEPEITYPDEGGDGPTETVKGPSSTSFGISTFSVILNVHI